MRIVKRLKILSAAAIATVAVLLAILFSTIAHYQQEKDGHLLVDNWYAVCSN